MFGSSSSPPKDSDSKLSSTPEKSEKTDANSDLAVSEEPKETDSKSAGSGERKSDEDGAGEEKRTRRSSGIGKVLSSAKNSFHPHPASSPTKTTAPSDKLFSTTPIAKLVKGDPALIVPQGSQNNAAGESHPGPRSSFRVGVTEDKNKKCRRTMEDTHAYLYNFLSTPAPTLPVSSPSSRKKSPIGEGSNSSTGESRPPVVETDNGYFAIFDGHAGTFAAEWCGKKLHLILEDIIKKNPNRPIPELLDETFTSVDQQLEKLPLKNSGCTAVIAVLRWEDRIPNPQSATGSTAIAPETAALAAKESAPEGQNDSKPQITVDVHSAAEAKLRELSSRQRVLYTANVGDARIVLCRNGKALRLSYDHKGSDDNEGKRIANAGGLILHNRVNGVLAVTRALGDAYMKDLVTGHPYTTETVIQPDIDEFLILACDGLWDVCTDQEAVDLVRSIQDPQQASKVLVDHALSRFSTDNLSCMTVRFNSKLVQDTVEARSERVGVEGDPASTVEGGVSESEAIITAAKMNTTLHADQPADLDLTSTNSIREEMEEQETGPELDPAGLKRAREKAKEGQQAEAMDTRPG